MIWLMYCLLARLLRNLLMRRASGRWSHAAPTFLHASRDPWYFLLHFSPFFFFFFILQEATVFAREWVVCAIRKNCGVLYAKGTCKQQIGAVLLLGFSRSCVPGCSSATKPQSRWVGICVARLRLFAAHLSITQLFPFPYIQKCHPLALCEPAEL